MDYEPLSWQNFSPGDLSFSFPQADSGDVPSAVMRSVHAFSYWSRTTLDDRLGLLEKIRDRLRGESEKLAILIARETGKPIREARLEMAGVVAKFDLTFSDAEIHLRDTRVSDGPHPAIVRKSPLGPCAVIAPFNFPIHLGNGATVAYLLAGNTVLFKPSPLAINVGLAYAEILQSILPPGVFEFVPGWGSIGRSLCHHPDVRGVCFTGSIPVGRRLAKSLAEDTSKILSLELGGKNTAIVCSDADLELAASAVAEGMCLTAGQRCNATSRVLVHHTIADEFIALLRSALSIFEPGNPLDDNTRLGPLINFSSRERYEQLISTDCGHWIVPGGILEKNSDEQHGYYVLPAVVIVDDPSRLDKVRLAQAETFAPILVLEIYSSDEQAIARHEAWDFGLTASIFTASEDTFENIGSRLSVGNLYRNLPTTFSPSTLPFGGWGASGNGRPGGRGFTRFAVREQAVQWKEDNQ